MRIGFDRQIFISQKYGGISRYFTDLYLGLSKTPEIEARLLFNQHNNEYLADRLIGTKMSSAVARSYIIAMCALNPRIKISGSVDIHHSTYYLGSPVKSSKHSMLVSSLYDMIPELYPFYFRKNYHFNKLAWFQSSDLIVSISQSAGNDLAYFYPELADRIRCIHLYSAFTSESKQKRPLSLEYHAGPYLLFVGARGAYKNGAMLLRAFAASRPVLHGHKLLFAGGGILTAHERSAIEQLGIAENVIHINANDEELWYLYRNAAAVLVPSIAEGFSLPVVEGLAADVPVICSDIPVHREVGGQFPEFVSPLHPMDWSDILAAVHLLRKPSLKLGSVAYVQNCNYYSKERLIRDHVQAYESLMT
jgi:glycosyltransferase involved in cell wall biosynthesis